VAPDGAKFTAVREAKLHAFGDAPSPAAGPPPIKSGHGIGHERPTSREEERRMLQRAISESAAEARGMICAAEQMGTARQTKRRVLQADGSLVVEQIDRKLWRGAAAQGWLVRPRSVRNYLQGSLFHGSYFYIAPTGERYTSRRNAVSSYESLRDAEATTCDASTAAAAGSSGPPGGDEPEFVTAVSDDDEEIGVNVSADEVSDEDGVEDEVDEDEPLAVIQLSEGCVVEANAAAGTSSAPSNTWDAARARHEAAAAAALAGGEYSDDDAGSDEGEDRERCMIWGCRRQLLRCFGVKADVGDAVGCAERAHVLCATCLVRWWEAEKALRMQNGLDAPLRKVCPCCKIEIRNTGDTRRESHLYHMGLLKVTGTWED